MNLFEGAQIHDSSIKLYNSKLNEWLDYMPDHMKTPICIIMFPDIAMKRLNSSLRANTNSNRHVFIVTILSLIRHRRDILSAFSQEEIDTIRTKWIIINNDNEAPIRQRRLENKPTDNQTKKEGSQLSFSEIVNIRNSLPIGSYERLLISMYTMIPPVRADYYSTQIVRGDEVPTEKNYIRIISPDRVESVLKDFKTAKTFKQITNVFPPELIKELNVSLEKNPRTYLFINANGKPHSRNSFTLWSRRALTRCFGKDFTLVFFRHIYATHFVMNNDMSRVTDAQIKDISDKMGHSSEMFKAYRWVLDGKKGELVIDGGEEE
jgi:hypothetical protein